MPTEDEKGLYVAEMLVLYYQLTGKLGPENSEDEEKFCKFCVEHPPTAKRDPELVARFRRAAKAAGERFKKLQEEGMSLEEIEQLNHVEQVVEQTVKALSDGNRKEVLVMEVFHKKDFASYSKPPDHDPGEAISDTWVMKTLTGKALIIKEMLITRGLAVRATQNIGDDSLIFHLYAGNG